MRITGTPSLPAPTFLSHINLARNRPGPADALPRRAALRRRPGPSTGQLHPFTQSTPIPRIPPSPRYAACVVCHFRLIWKAPLRPPLLLVDIKDSIYNRIFLAIC